MVYRVIVDGAGRRVLGWSAERLPFDPKGPMGDFRRVLAAGCGTLVAKPGQILQAIYSSTDTSFVDVENVLTYNVGTRAIRAAAAYGIRLERRYAFVPAAEPAEIQMAHHYDYRLVEPGPSFTWWRAGDVLGSVRLTASRELFGSLNARRWWVAARRGEVRMNRSTDKIPERFALTVALTPPMGSRMALVNVLKPLIDGLVASMHAYPVAIESQIITLLAEVEQSLSPRELTELLLIPDIAPLGRCRFIFQWGNGLMLSPADDRIVALDLRINSGGEPGVVAAQFTDVEPLAQAAEFA
jgi:hypothetical protein